jgi:hypothetical protein
MNYMFILCVDFPIVLDYDEMNYNIVIEFFIMYFEVHIIVICNNYEYVVGMNGSVKFVET